MQPYESFPDFPGSKFVFAMLSALDGILEFFESLMALYEIALALCAVCGTLIDETKIVNRKY
jgi:hypothetical protein